MRKPVMESRSKANARPSRMMCLLFLGGSLIFAATAVHSQSDTQKAIATLSPGSQEVARQLATLAELPAEQWKEHVGDLAHGESRIWRTAIGLWQVRTRAGTETRRGFGGESKCPRL